MLMVLGGNPPFLIFFLGDLFFDPAIDSLIGTWRSPHFDFVLRFGQSKIILFEIDSDLNQTV